MVKKSVTLGLAGIAIAKGSVSAARVLKHPTDTAGRRIAPGGAEMAPKADQASAVERIPAGVGANGTGGGPGTSGSASTRWPNSGVAERSAQFKEIILPHLDAAYNLARFLTRDRDAAEDIVQEAFLRAFRAFDGFRGEDAKAWILAVTRNCFLTWAKSRKAEPVVPLQDDSADDAPARENPIEGFTEEDQDNPEKALIRRNEIEAVRALIEDLPHPFREVLVLRELEELSYQEIADLTETPIGTVMSRLARGRQMFAKAWHGLSQKKRAADE